jgi:hypothetical protein
VPYSIVNVPALGYDLVRLPHGEQVARVLRVALSCGPDELGRLAERHPGQSRAPRWDQVLGGRRHEDMRAALRLADRALERAVAGDSGSSSVLLRRLERAAIGDLPALERVLRHDILDWTWLRSGDLAVQDPDHARACDVLADAAASAYCSENLDDETRRALAGPFLAARLISDGPTGVGDVDALLGAVATSNEPARAAWRRAVDAIRPGTVTWAPAMHQATWAVHLADRLRLAADAQLAAVVAFREGGFEARDAAYGVWNALSGAVQATVAADLLPEADHARLTAVWVRVREELDPGHV